MRVLKGILTQGEKYECKRDETRTLGQHGKYG